MMIDFFSNENLTLPRVEGPYGRGLRIVADATKVNEKKEEKKKKLIRIRLLGIEHLRYMNGVQGCYVLSKNYMTSQ